MASLNYAASLVKLDKPVVTRQELAQLLKVERPRTLSFVIYKLVQAKLLARLEAGKYLNLTKKPDLFLVANSIYHPSYVSLESALNYWGVLAQFPSIVTSVTPRKTFLKETPVGIFSFSHVAPRLFLGFLKLDSFLIAEKEKALFDYLYLVAKGVKKPGYLDELNLTETNWQKVSFYFRLIKSRNLKTALSRLVNQLKPNHAH